MARTPFSLVDEINQVRALAPRQNPLPKPQRRPPYRPRLTRGIQGMDPVAERNVHNQLVEVTCETDAGQYVVAGGGVRWHTAKSQALRYFLITPKLLTNLRYHRKSKILVINNGEF